VPRFETCGPDQFSFAQCVSGVFRLSGYASGRLRCENYWRRGWESNPTRALRTRKLLIIEKRSESAKISSVWHTYGTRGFACSHTALISNVVSPQPVAENQTDDSESPFTCGVRVVVGQNNVKRCTAEQSRHHQPHRQHPPLFLGELWVGVSHRLRVLRPVLDDGDGLAQMFAEDRFLSLIDRRSAG